MRAQLTLRSWTHSEENKRRTLQRTDISAAISKTDIFDFLVDIVPREDVKLEGAAEGSDGAPGSSGGGGGGGGGGGDMSTGAAYGQPHGMPHGLFMMPPGMPPPPGGMGYRQ